jgi:hypothetical protein
LEYKLDWRNSPLKANSAKDFMSFFFARQFSGGVVQTISPHLKGSSDLLPVPPEFIAAASANPPNR